MEETQNISMSPRVSPLGGHSSKPTVIPPSRVRPEPVTRHHIESISLLHAISPELISRIIIKNDENNEKKIVRIPMLNPVIRAAHFR
jgi:hypothetical protein